MTLKSSLNILRDPDPPSNNGGQSQATQPQPQQQSQLSPDQQKIASAIDKANAAAPPDAIRQPKVHKTIFTAPPNTVLEKDFSVGNDMELVEGDQRPEVKIENDKADNTRGKPEVQQQQKPPAQQQKKPDVQQQQTAPKDGKQQPQQVKVGDAKPFDYSNFTPEEITHLKQMSNPAREWVAKTLKELGDLRNQKPGVYYQHQDAYLLDPQYKELNVAIDFAGKEAEHYRQQLLNVRQGKPWMFLEAFDDKGNPILKGPFKATDEADINLANALQVVSSQLGQMQQQRQRYGSQYQDQIKRDEAVLQAERAARFEWVKDPAKLEEKVDIGGKAGQVAVKQIREDFKSLFAKYHHGNPVLEVAADMFAALQIYGARIRELEGANQQQQRITQDVLSGEPNVETQIGNGKSEREDFDMVGLPE